MFATTVIGLSPAWGGDLHQLWDRQCGGCHGHAGPFARRSLVEVDGRLVGRASGRDLAELLTIHNGGYGPEDIASFRIMLAAQLATPPLYAERCGACHDTAAELIRDLVIRGDDGDLRGRAGGHRLAEFLPAHGTLSADQTRAIMSVLDRVESEVNHR
ncbi:hypothetical protein [Magnetospirillum sp. LM-5]|uniref:hypothetical protein n=1 Tax=Magnetospirillum sp. LM-5 TaxID=2681466 RepID=UPI00156F127D|nr:hypothetical protein [Magnetospirillum sp. LM-5]